MPSSPTRAVLVTLARVLPPALFILAIITSHPSVNAVGSAAIVPLQRATSTPGPTPTPEPVREYAGIYTAGFEWSVFVSATDRCPGYGVGWWLWPNSEFADRFDMLYPPQPQPPSGPEYVYTRFRGRLSPPGSYGHRDAYDRQVNVIELLEMVRIDRCPLPDGPPTPGPLSSRILLPMALRR